jgi:hypothetical protein
LKSCAEWRAATESSPEPVNLSPPDSWVLSKQRL